MRREDLVVTSSLRLHPPHVRLHPVELTVHLTVLLLQVGDLLVQTHHVSPLVARVGRQGPGPEGGFDMTAVLEDPGTHGEGGLHGAGLVPVGVRTPGGAG